MEFEMFELFEKTPDLVCIADRQGFFKKVNKAVLQKLGYSEEELFSQPIRNFIHPDDRELTGRKRSELLEGKALVNFQNRYVTKSGTTIWLQWTSVYLPEKKLVFAIAKDITENKKREQETEARYHTFKKLALHFKSRAEQDRQYVAEELHEDLAQLAAAQKMNLAWLKQHIGEQPEAVEERMEETELMADLLLRSIRDLSFSVSPNMIEDMGLHATIEWKCNEFTRLTGIPCTLEFDSDEPLLSRELKIDLFRVCEEALENVLQHSAAKEVWVTLQETDNRVALIITDNGKGFDTGQVQPAAGLQNLQHLAVAVNGELHVESQPGIGTKISFSAAKPEKAVA